MGEFNTICCHAHLHDYCYVPGLRSQANMMCGHSTITAREETMNLYVICFRYQR